MREQLPIPSGKGPILLLSSHPPWCHLHLDLPLGFARLHGEQKDSEECQKMNITRRTVTSSLFSETDRFTDVSSRTQGPPASSAGAVGRTAAAHPTQGTSHPGDAGLVITFLHNENPNSLLYLCNWGKRPVGQDHYCGGIQLSGQYTWPDLSTSAASSRSTPVTALIISHYT